MSLALVYCRASAGIHSPLVTVEVYLSPGLPGFSIVGLPETAVKESKDRVRSAILMSRFEFPLQRIVVNLAPADLPKEGGRFDLAIAMGILAASKQVPQEKIRDYEFLGELALSGELRSVKGALLVALAAQRAERALVVAKANASEAALAKNAEIYAASHLLDVCAHLRGRPLLERCQPSLPLKLSPVAPLLDLADVSGQRQAKRALEIAAAGKHSLLLLGPPGTGKTMLANRLGGLLPALSEEQALEVAAVGSMGLEGFDPQKWCELPFRSPHHTASTAALVGGGRPPRPGEISLAHQGVLFLDELPEFHRSVLESLREPLESGLITISRATIQAQFPARFQLVAAMNPCPCGHVTQGDSRCRCTPQQVARYLAKLSGPFLDRLDMHIEVPALPPSVLSAASKEREESSHTVQARVIEARDRQMTRQGKPNSELSVTELKKVAVLEPAAQHLLQAVMEKFQFSARVYHRLLKVAQTIADLRSVSILTTSEVSEALLYRSLDKQLSSLRQG